ncbi:MAG: hypothetical protein NC081_10200 [Roseburia sp.]|nr:hypothetical protein [Roseburia sp.]
MEGAQVFSCSAGKGFMGKAKNADNLFLKVENDKVSGRGYVCNAEGKNGYIDDFSFAIGEVGEVSITDYNGSQALMFGARVTNLYGAKKAKIALPQLKNMDLVLGLLNRLKKSTESQADDWQTAPKAPAAARPAPAPVPPAPAQMKPEPVVNQQKPMAEEKAPEPAKQEEKADNKLSSEEFQRRMEKLTVLKDCGLLGEKEFNAKKIELVGEFCDLTEFNEKIQKMVILKDCGVLSEKEFEANRTDIIRECCNVDTADMDEYRRNIQKLSYLELGGVITAEEFAKTQTLLAKDVEFALSDSKEEFSKKLKKLPILKESQIITSAEYQTRVDALIKMIDVSPEEPFEHLVDKLSKWPLLAEERYISAAELKDKQKDMIARCVTMDWTTMDELEKVVRKMTALRQGDWMTDMEFYSKKEDLLRQIDGMEDYPKKLRARMLLPRVGFISEDDYLKWRQSCIDEVFSPCASMVEFKGKANNLMELQKAGVITEKEFVDFKSKLMSEL